MHLVSQAPKTLSHKTPTLPSFHMLKPLHRVPLATSRHGGLLPSTVKLKCPLLYKADPESLRLGQQSWPEPPEQTLMMEHITLLSMTGFSTNTFSKYSWRVTFPPNSPNTQNRHSTKHLENRRLPHWIWSASSEFILLLIQFSFSY